MNDATIIVARLLQYVGGCGLFGASVFVIVHSYATNLISPSARRVLFASLAILVILGALLWLMSEAAMIVDSPIAGLRIADFAAVASSTTFGRVCVARVALALIALGFALMTEAVFANRGLVLISGLLLASFAWTGHGAMESGANGAFHLSADIIHLLAAGLWLGAFVPLLVLLALAQGRRLESTGPHLWQALARFAGTGTLAVILLVVTGVINSWFLIGPAHALGALQSLYGQILMVKIALFTAMLSLAAVNRLRLTPALGRSVTQHNTGAAAAISRLTRSVTLEAGLGLLVLLAVSWLGTVEPMIGMPMP